MMHTAKLKLSEDNAAVDINVSVSNSGPAMPYDLCRFVLCLSTEFNETAIVFEITTPFKLVQSLLNYFYSLNLLRNDVHLFSKQLLTHLHSKLL